MKSLQLISYKTANDLNDTAVFEFDVENDFFNYDEMMTKILQRELPKNNVKKIFSEARLIHPEDRISFQNKMHQLFEKFLRTAPLQDFESDFRIYVGGKMYIWVHLAYRVKVENGYAKFVTGFLQNINTAREEKVKMRGMVERDPMTGLYSKTHSNYLVNKIVSDENLRNALFVIDMDNFKQVNDKLGHLIGDAVILDVALSLKRLFRKTDILGHIGGDEFMVLLRDIKTEEVIDIKCNKLHSLLKRDYTNENETVSVSASIGVAISPAHGKDFKTLFSHADAALYHVKRSGKNNHAIYEENFTDNRAVKNNEEKVQSQDYQQLLSNPSDYILHMMLKTEDPKLTVQILLEIFAKFFNVQRAYVLWNVDGPYFPRILFDYVSGNYKNAEISHNAEVRRRMWKKYQNTKFGRFTECSDTNKLSEKARNIFQRGEIQAYLECAVMDGDIFLGSVGFDDCKSARVWTNSEYEVLGAFSNILHRFLLAQMYYEMIKKGSAWDFSF